ncbi:MAG: penicillin acylase family protein, partial [Deltaproteobacteria bacterium]|nr:penicillin acylase family protein [Deltaproteobacteria bacterium]
MNTSYHVRGNISCLVYFIIFLLSAAFLFSGCTRILDRHFADTTGPMEGEITIKGLKKTVTVRRDHMGIPFVDGQRLEDLAFAIGYVNASDRLNQMIGLKMISQGRLAEMAGSPFTDIDIYIRTLNLNKAARILYEE